MIVARENEEYYYGLPEQQPELVKRVRRRSVTRGLPRRDQLALTGLVLLSFCCCVIVAYYYAQVLIIGYQLNTAEEELTRLRVESHDLYAQVNQLTSLENIEAIAVQRLGMVKPQNDRIVVVQEAAPVINQAEHGDTVQAGTGSPDSSMVKQREQNWLLRTFADMVSVWEASIQTS